jgi:hypothetical protein
MLDKEATSCWIWRGFKLASWAMLRFAAGLVVAGAAPVVCPVDDAIAACNTFKKEKELKKKN